jgi:hypothetical protein
MGRMLTPLSAVCPSWLLKSMVDSCSDGWSMEKGRNNLACCTEFYVYITNGSILKARVEIPSKD